MEEIYSVRLSKFSAFRGDDIYLNSVDLDIKKGEVVFFLGKNGCGKSTVLSLFRVNRDGDTAKFLGEFNVIKEKECFNIVKSD